MCLTGVLGRPQYTHESSVDTSDPGDRLLGLRLHLHQDGGHDTQVSLRHVHLATGQSQHHWSVSTSLISLMVIGQSRLHRCQNRDQNIPDWHKIGQI